MAAFFVGAIIGVVQFLLLRIIARGVLADGVKASVILCILAKLAIYALGAAVMIIWFAGFILPCGIGLGTAVLAASLIWFVSECISAKRGKGDGDK